MARLWISGFVSKNDIPGYVGWTDVWEDAVTSRQGSTNGNHTEESPALFKQLPQKCWSADKAVRNWKPWLFRVRMPLVQQLWAGNLDRTQKLRPEQPRNPAGLTSGNTPQGMETGMLRATVGDNAGIKSTQKSTENGWRRHRVYKVRSLTEVGQRG